MKDADVVLQALDEALADLREAAAKGAVVVEGLRDREALLELGVEGTVEVLNRGAPLLALCDALASKHASIAVLTDWDPKGEELARQLEGGLRRPTLALDVGIRDRLRKVARGQVHAVEELPSFRRRVAAAAASKGPSVQAPTDWEWRKEAAAERRANQKRRGAPPGRRP